MKQTRDGKHILALKKELEDIAKDLADPNYLATVPYGFIHPVETFLHQAYLSVCNISNFLGEKDSHKKEMPWREVVNEHDYFKGVNK